MFVFCSAEVDTDSPGYREAHSEVHGTAVVPDHGERRRLHGHHTASSRVRAVQPRGVYNIGKGAGHNT